MLIVDDPLLALLLRFVVNTDQATSADEEFLQRQLKTIREHLTQFPADQQGAKAMEWIEQHAERYRRDWQRRTVSTRTAYLRCADCPLTGRGAAERCEIHEQWLYLLRQYTAGHVHSRAYVESALGLLQQYKDALKLRGAEHDQSKGQSSKSKKKKNKEKKKGKKAKKDT